MGFSFKKFFKGININPGTTTASAKGDIEVDSSTGKMGFHNGTTVSPVVTEAHQATLTNKILSGNTATNLISGSGTTTLNTTGTVTLPNATDTLVGKATTDVLTNKALSDSTTTIVDASDNTKKIAFDAGGTASTTTTITGAQTANRVVTLPDATDTLVGKATTDAFTNKTFSDAPTLAQIATPSTPASGFNKLYPKSDGYFYNLDPSGAERKIGAGGGVINYVLNPDAEGGVTGWATYADAAGTSPVNGTGGSPTTTWTRTTSTPLRGTGSFLLTKDAANRQGEGASYDFTIDVADQAKVLAVNFDYTVASGTYADSDLTCWLYDVTNSVVIQPSGSSILNGATGLPLKQRAEFQTASNSTSYRLIIHVTSTSASAYTVKVDNVFVGPTTTQIGAFVSDSINYTPTLNNITGTINYASWSRRGEMMVLRGMVTMTNTVAGVMSVSLPAGYSIDTNKLQATAASMILGSVTAFDQSANLYSGSVVYSTATTISFAGPDSFSSRWNASTPFTWVSTDTISWTCEVPIVGWSSGQLLSSETDTRIVAARYATTSGQTISNSTIDIVDYNTKTYDTHGAATTGASWKYTAQVPGFYRVSAQVYFSSQTYAVSNRIQLYIYKNGSQWSLLQRQNIETANTNFYSVYGSDVVQMSAGDYVDIRVANNRTAGNTALDTSADNWMGIERVSGPAQIAASESVNCRITDTAGASISTSNTIYKYATTSFDSHNAYSASTGLYTVPVSGKYLVSAKLGTASVNLSTSQQYYILIYKNGNLNTYGLNVTGTGAANVLAAGVTDMVSCVAGDTLAIWAISAVGTTANTTAGVNYFNITRVGN